jgi:hypothetical protein
MKGQLVEGKKGAQQHGTVDGAREERDVLAKIAEDLEFFTEPE